MLTSHSKAQVGLTVLIAMIATACAVRAYPGGPVVLITKDPQNPVMCAAGDSATVGNAGGSVNARAHRHELEVPAGAVQGQDIRFVMSDLGKPYIGVNVYHRGPPGTAFDPPLTLRLSYDGCTVANETELKIYRWTTGVPGGPDWVEVSGSSVDTQANTVTAPLRSLSQYALGAG